MFHEWIARLFVKKKNDNFSYLEYNTHNKKRISPIIPWACHHWTDCPSFETVVVVLYPIMLSRLGLQFVSVI